MRVLTWNINGVRTLPQYHPWNTLKTFDDLLNHLEADVICFQEMKSSRPALPKQVALPPSFDSFFSFPVRKTGYSGTAIYTRRTVAVPLKAEEGLTGLLQPVKPPLSSHERISKPGNYPPDRDDPPQPTEEEEDVDYLTLDSEGRAVVVDLGLFVLICVYCPNDGTGTPERDKFKMAYHRLLSARVAVLIEEGRQVMVVGDLNACAAVEDHCEGQMMVEKGWKEGLEGEEGFWGKEYRRWIRDWLVKEDGTGGCMIDIVRQFWPDRKGMYTCWNTKISARETNYGTRIDFILITPGLVPWIKAADIQPQIKGSDHCPVFVDLHDEISNPDGTTTKLADMLGARPAPDGTPAEPPRMAAKFWDEHKQKLLSTFFGKGKKEKGADSPTPPLETAMTQPNQDVVLVSDTLPSTSLASQLTPPAPQKSRVTSQTTPSSQPAQSNVPAASPPSNAMSTTATSSKRKLVPESPDVKALKKAKQNVKVGKTEKVKPGQSTLATFFSQPKASGSTSKSKSVAATSSASASSTSKGLARKRSSAGQSLPDINPIYVDGDEDLTSATTNIPSDALTQPVSDDDRIPSDHEQDMEADYQFALMLSQSSDNDFTSSQSSSKGKEKDSRLKENKRKAWDNLLAPTQPPKCTVHQEPAKEFTVNKPGPNKGKRFFICSRPVGPGYDKGRSERLREHVDPQWKCDFFKWSSDVRKEMARNGSGKGVS